MTALLESPAAGDVLTRPMPTRPLGPFPWEASVVTLGGVKWDTLCSDAEAVELVHRAVELGINTFDTAHGYGDGESERKLGLALEGMRRRVWINTKTLDRTYDGARRQVEVSLQRLRTDYVDLLFVHSLDSDDHRRQILAAESVLKALEEYRDAGHIRHIGISGHWVRDVMARIIQEYPFEAVLCPCGLFNAAYDYSFMDTVAPVARSRGMAVLGMKVMGAGRVKHARRREPYIRYALHQPIDTAVIGVDSISQLEEIVQVAKSHPEPLTEHEVRDLCPEALEITRTFDGLEFNWVEPYRKRA